MSSSRTRAPKGATPAAPLGVPDGELKKSRRGRDGAQRKRLMVPSAAKVLLIGHF
jgi:hypothetical protein